MKQSLTTLVAKLSGMRYPKILSFQLTLTLSPL